MWRLAPQALQALRELYQGVGQVLMSYPAMKRKRRLLLQKELWKRAKQAFRVSFLNKKILPLQIFWEHSTLGGKKVSRHTTLCQLWITCFSCSHGKGRNRGCLLSFCPG